MGIILPILPGLFLIWLGAFFWAWGDGFQQIGWLTLAILGGLAVLGWGLDLVLAPAMSRGVGVSWRAIGGAVLGGFLGGIFLSFIPIFGTLAGVLIGAVVGMWYIEYRIRGDEAAATAAVSVYLRGVAVATLLNLLIAFIMIALFLWQAFG